MTREPTWEHETLELLREAQSETEIARRRVEQAQDMLEAAQRREDAVRMTLNMYRAKYGGPPLDDDMHEVNEQVLQRYQGLTLKDIVRRWADDHGGEVILREMSRTLTAVGLWRDRASASGSLHSTMSRMPEFEKVRPGEFRRSTRREFTEVVPAPTATEPQLGQLEEQPTEDSQPLYQRSNIVMHPSGHRR